jgi:hypothetical protein
MLIVFQQDTLLSVNNAFEGRVFLDPNTTSTVNVSSFISNLYPTLDSSSVESAVELYAKTGMEPFDQAVGIMGESIFICPTYHVLEGFPGAKWKGEFAIPPGNHGDDTLYYFPS